MTKGDIITLEDNEQFLLLMENEIEGRKFFYANKVDNEENTTSEYEIFEQLTEDGDNYLEIVEDEDEREFLTNVFSADLVEFASDVESGKITCE